MNFEILHGTPSTCQGWLVGTIGTPKRIKDKAVEGIFRILRKFRDIWLTPLSRVYNIT